MRRLVVAVTGASGAIYADLLLRALAGRRDEWERVGVVFSRNARITWEWELGESPPQLAAMDYYDNDDFFAPFASGSAHYDTMIVIPASMGTIGRMAHGISDSLILRAADVMLKERRRLVLVPREMPLSAIHLKNMAVLADAGAVICPAMPAYYSKPETVRALARTVVERVLRLAGFDHDGFRWGD